MDSPIPPCDSSAVFDWCAPHYYRVPYMLWYWHALSQLDKNLKCDMENHMQVVTLFFDGPSEEHPHPAARKLFSWFE